MSVEGSFNKYFFSNIWHILISQSWKLSNIAGLPKRAIEPNIRIHHSRSYCRNFDFFNTDIFQEI